MQFGRPPARLFADGKGESRKYDEPEFEKHEGPGKHYANGSPWHYSGVGFGNRAVQ